MFRAESAKRGRGARKAGSPAGEEPPPPPPHLTPAPVRGYRGTAGPLLRRYGGLAAGRERRQTPARLLLPRRRPPPSPTETPSAAASLSAVSFPRPPPPRRVTVSRSRPSCRRRLRRARPVPEKSASAATSALHTRITQERRRRSRRGSTCLRRGCCPASPSLMVRERAARGGGGRPAASHDAAGPGWRHGHPRPAGSPPPRGSVGCPGTAQAAGRGSRSRGRAEQPCPRPSPQRSRPPPRRGSCPDRRGATGGASPPPRGSPWGRWGREEVSRRRRAWHCPQRTSCGPG